MSAPAPAQASSGPIDNNDINDWKTRINEVLAKPGEVVNSKSPATAQPWHESFLGCFSPIDLCCMTYCCPCVTFGKTHHRLRKDVNLAGYEPINTSCLMVLAAGWVGCCWIPLAMQRADIRAKYNLQGDCLTDIAAACCCGLCDLVQQEKEATYQGLNQLNQASKQPYQAPGGMTYTEPAPAPQ
ncbi:PLAC8-domain-containing protein [Coniochaeta ligniaria NRRL 30616]|uniref:PLAC8-domain-containing protein n=1 Tax=Coniochaeta ligniaria NRRL 30616 TaxID=1408157 RepID=A0A1J7I5P9_9PEZI|nr:PLAC8-domain-containing protein [Coniochaeta ligniaria NRRL 30616]